jgi:ABC-type multidrug transport system fused ATPase/permease subunit
MGGVAEETLTAIKVVASFGREEKELEKFVTWSLRTLKVAKRSQKMMSFMVGLMKFCIFFFYTFALLIGTVFMLNGHIIKKTGEVIGPREVLIVVIALITGFIGLIAALPNIQTISAARVQGKLIFDVIDRVPEIRSHESSSSDDKLVLKSHIAF